MVNVLSAIKHFQKTLTDKKSALIVGFLTKEKIVPEDIFYGQKRIQKNSSCNMKKNTKTVEEYLELIQNG